MNPDKGEPVRLPTADEVRRDAAAWSPAAWVPSLAGLPVCLAALEAIELAEGRSVTRGYLMDLAAGFGIDPSADLALQLLTASLVWGFGTTGYGPYRARVILKGASERGEATRQMAVLAASDAARAYKEGLWADARPVVPGLGTAFGTKFLYFASFAGEPSPRPLIYDANVALALTERSDYREALRRVRASVGHRAGDDRPSSPGRLRTYEYELYLDYSSSTAGEGRQPDAVEMLLFEEGRHLRERSKER